jgi:AcrR family transcriptional regulator
VLDAARTEFAAVGYEQASVRAIARTAGVDPALVHHYFGTKQQLFIAALDFPLDPQLLAEQVFGGDPDTIGERIARFVFTLWEDPQARDRLLATLRAAVGSDEIAELIRGFMVRELISMVAPRLKVPNPHLRVELAMSQIIGLATARYVIAAPHLAAASVEELVALVAPTLQRYLTDG